MVELNNPCIQLVDTLILKYAALKTAKDAELLQAQKDTKQHQVDIMNSPDRLNELIPLVDIAEAKKVYVTGEIDLLVGLLADMNSVKTTLPIKVEVPDPTNYQQLISRVGTLETNLLALTSRVTLLE